MTGLSSALAAIVERLHREAFATGRDPRSQEYKHGVLAALRYRAGLISSIKKEHERYELGTAQSDAFLSGTGEGNEIWRRYKNPETPDS